MQLLEAAWSAQAPLTTLILQHTPVTNTGLQICATAFKGLTSLYLSYCRQISNSGLLQLKTLQQLQTLDLYNVPMVSDGAMAHLVKCLPVLQMLYIGHHTGVLHTSSHRCMTTMSAITSSSSSSSSGDGSSSGFSSYTSVGAHSSAGSRRDHGGSTEGLVELQAACTARGRGLQLLCRNPNSTSDFEQRTLQKCLG